MRHLKVKDFIKDLGVEKEDDVALLEKTIKCYIPTKKEDDMNKLSEMLGDLYPKILNFETIQLSEITALRKQLAETFQIFRKDEDSLKILRDMKANIDNKVKRKEKFKLISFKTMQRITWGLDDGFYLIGADSNIGKTMMLIQLLVDVLVANPDKKVCFVSSDDTKRKVMRRIVACMTVMKSNGISNATTINNAEWAFDTYNSDRERIREECYIILDHFLQTKQLQIFTGKVGIREIEAIAEENSKALLLVDSSYKIRTGKIGLDKDIGQSELLKDISVDNEMTVVAVKDVRKGTERGAGINSSGERKTAPLSLNDLKGDGSWIYEPDFIGLLWMEGRECILSMQKNKIDSEVGIARLEMFKAYSGMREIK